MANKKIVRNEEKNNMEQNKLVEKIKDYVFADKWPRVLCDISLWCGNKDGYCPHYDCWALDRLKSFSDRQWENAIKKVKITFKYNLLDERQFCEFVEDVLAELRYKTPSRRKEGKNDEKDR